MSTFGTNGHAVGSAGGGRAGLMLAGELALAGADVAIVERRASQELDSSRSRGLQARTIEVPAQRGSAERIPSQGTVAQVTNFSGINVNISDFPSRHPYGAFNQWDGALGSVVTINE